LQNEVKFVECQSIIRATATFLVAQTKIYGTSVNYLIKQNIKLGSKINI